MALTRERKEEVLDSYLDRLSRSQVVIWANYSGVKVEQFQALRRQLRQVDAEAVVVKNTLMRVALERAGLPYDKEIMDGPCAVTFVHGDIAATTKAVTAFARENEQLFKIVGGLVGGKLVDAAQVTALNTLPSREVLLGRVVGGIAAPISGFVGGLSAILRGLVNVVNARREQLEGSAA